jgi:hypothetical protein
MTTNFDVSRCRHSDALLSNAKMLARYTPNATNQKHPLCRDWQSMRQYNVCPGTGGAENNLRQIH